VLTTVHPLLPHSQGVASATPSSRFYLDRPELHRAEAEDLAVVLNGG
jgi:hypothetical protein